MTLMEYQSKEILAQYGVPVPAARIAATPEEAESRCREINARKYVVKAQIGAGGRGVSGGIRFAATPSLVQEEAARLLGSVLVTPQTGASGQKVERVTVEAMVDMSDAIYLALVIDPATGKPTLLASAEGGTAFEEKARQDMSLVTSLTLDATTPPERISALIVGLGLDAPAADAAVAVVLAAKKAFDENDMLLLEMNPFARTAEGDWMAVDAKIVLDANALFRHPDLQALQVERDLSAAERVAQENEINLVKLAGSIGVVVNGAGLGLATNDMIVDAGGQPANFMDIRTTATSFQIARGVELLLEDPDVKVILVNVHGGGMTVCDTVAEGVAFAYSRSRRTVPIVARMAGVGDSYALRILEDRKLPVETRDTIGAAVLRAVALAGSG